MSAIVIGAGPSATQIIKRMSQSSTYYARLIAIELVHRNRDQVEEADGVTYLSILDPQAVGPDDPSRSTLPPSDVLAAGLLGTLRPLIRSPHPIVVIGDLADTVMLVLMPALMADLGANLIRLSLAGTLPFPFEGAKRAQVATQIIQEARNAGLTVLAVNPEQWNMPIVNPRQVVSRSLDCVELLLVSFALNVAILGEGLLDDGDDTGSKTLWIRN